jgi:hypothetical protein
MKAAENGHTDIVTSLLSAGAYVNAKDQVRVSLAIARYVYSSCVSTLTDIYACILMCLCDDRMTGPLL